MKEARKVLDTYKKLLSIIARRTPVMVAMTFVLAIVSGRADLCQHACEPAHCGRRIAGGLGRDGLRRLLSLAGAAGGHHGAATCHRFVHIQLYHIALANDPQYRLQGRNAEEAGGA